MTSVKQWTITVSIDEHDEWTHAKAELAAGTDHAPLRADGRAEHDATAIAPSVAGDELAVARSLSSLASQLTQTARQRVNLPADLRAGRY